MGKGREDWEKGVPGKREGKGFPWMGKGMEAEGLKQPAYDNLSQKLL